ncbi:hypothetical protein C1646_772404 [Rhizophagus diaphanus]|nr:hypothetical protein C1646_772404 [Rhizophagus diaphanus] [Rhizophagus sp. MUCL 43196]
MYNITLFLIKINNLLFKCLAGAQIKKSKSVPAKHDNKNDIPDKENKSSSKLEELEYQERILALKEREIALREREANVRVMELANLEKSYTPHTSNANIWKHIEDDDDAFNETFVIYGTELPDTDEQDKGKFQPAWKQEDLKV